MKEHVFNQKCSAKQTQEYPKVCVNLQTDVR